MPVEQVQLHVLQMMIYASIRRDLEEEQKQLSSGHICLLLVSLEPGIQFDAISFFPPILSVHFEFCLLLSSSHRLLSVGQVSGTILLLISSWQEV
ncbi:hypothetical protein D3C80_2017030 [compost metagenome]